MFYISENDLETNETLEAEDIGKPAILVNGCILIVESAEKAKEVERMLAEDNRKQGK